MKARGLPISYAASLVDVAGELGASRQALTNATDLQRELNSDTTAPLSLDKFRQLYTAAVAATGKKSLPLYLGQRLPLTLLHGLAYTLVSCRTLHQVVEILTKHFRLLLNNNSLLLKTEDQQAVLEYHPAREALLGRRQDTELFFAGILSALQHLLPEGQLRAEIDLGYAPTEYPDDYPSVLGNPVKFNQRISRVTFPLSLLNEKPEHVSPELLKLYKKQCAEILAQMPGCDGLHLKVREYLLSSRQHFPSLEQTASHFHISPRTFRRRLSDEDVSFQKVLDEVRCELAQMYLRNPALSVHHTADLLGFHDVSNFRRAFLRWTQGVSPSEFRKNAAHSERSESQPEDRH